MSADDAPTHAEIRAELWVDAEQPPPAWLRWPLSMTRPEVDRRGEPLVVVRCEKHPGWVKFGHREHVEWHARRHITDEHGGAA